MVIAKMHIYGEAVRAFDASDLVYLVGLYARVIGIEVLPSRANVYVASRAQAKNAVDMLQGRHFPGILKWPMKVGLADLTSDELQQLELEALPTVRKRPEPVEPVWRFTVKAKNQELDPDVVLALFTPFGKVCWSNRPDAHRIDVMLRTKCSWRGVVARFSGAVQGEQRLKICYDSTSECPTVVSSKVIRS